MTQVHSRGRRQRSENELLVLANVPLYEYYNRFVVPLDPNKYSPMTESRNTGVCPFHHDTDPSFHWWKAKDLFHCFGCGTSGDVIKIHTLLRRRYDGISMKVEQVVQELAQAFGITLNEETGDIVKSSFERARELMFDKESYKIPKGQFSLAEFRNLNNRVKRSNYPEHIKIQNYEQLDLVASVALSTQK